MPPELIHVQPTPELRRDFAAWAVAQVPKVRTVSSTVFAMPGALFTEVPERLLIGSVVDGHRYISPDEDQEDTEPGDGPDDLLGVFQPEVEGTPGEPLPPVPDDAYPPDATPLDPPDFAPLEDAPAGDEASDSSDRAADTGDEGDGVTCDVCDRPFKSERGRDTHRRQAHPEA
ncbi:hypothetical protein ACFYSF_22355 [Streptomyces canus]|uniref:hypothetical protein n=1 Tax=Streptomyces canus TaxID=58343 RepID=UPI003677379A